MMAKLLMSVIQLMILGDIIEKNFSFLCCICIVNFYHVCPRDWTQAIIFGSMNLYSLSHLAGSEIVFFLLLFIYLFMETGSH